MPESIHPSAVRLRQHLWGTLTFSVGACYHTRRRLQTLITGASTQLVTISERQLWTAHKPKETIPTTFVESDDMQEQSLAIRTCSAAQR